MEVEGRNDLILTQADFQKLFSLVRSMRADLAERLEDELNRASVVPDTELPRDVVAMNSKVKYRDLESGTESVVTLVYPHEANLEENRISVLAPIGSALIGLRAGQIIRWPLPNGKEKRIEVVSVLDQAKPE